MLKAFSNSYKYFHILITHKHKMIVKSNRQILIFCGTERTRKYDISNTIDIFNMIFTIWYFQITII